MHFRRRRLTRNEVIENGSKETETTVRVNLFINNTLEDTVVTLSKAEALELSISLLLLEINVPSARARD